MKFRAFCCEDVEWIYWSADKSLARPGRKQARKHFTYARDFNNIETRAVIKYFFLPTRQGAEGNYIIIYLFAAIGLLPGGSGYFTCQQNMKSVTTKFKSGRLHEKHVVATWNLGNHLSICL